MQKRGAGVADFREEERQILGSVLPNVAAALRTPLNNLHMAAERIARQLPDDGLEGAVLQQSYHRLLRLVSNLSMGPELLSEQPFQLQNLELVAWLGDLCQQAASAADALGIGLSFICRERYLVAAVHREYLERLVWNLLSNALKFTPPDGSITVTLAEKAGQLLLSVQDTGCGISSEHLETLFHRWSQRDRMEPPSHGIGLGLLICRRVAEGHGGRLLLESREGVGTLVRVSLPHVRRDGQVRDLRTDYAGGFSHVMMELSDALPYQAFYRLYLD